MIIKQCCSGGDWRESWELYFIIFESDISTGVQLNADNHNFLTYRSPNENRVSDFLYKD